MASGDVTQHALPSWDRVDVLESHLAVAVRRGRHVQAVCQLGSKRRITSP